MLPLVVCTRCAVMLRDDKLNYFCLDAELKMRDYRSSSPNIKPCRTVPGGSINRRKIDVPLWA